MHERTGDWTQKFSYTFSEKYIIYINIRRESVRNRSPVRTWVLGGGEIELA